MRFLCALTSHFDFPVATCRVAAPTRAELGRATWTFLHAAATNFPKENVTEEHHQAARDLLHVRPCLSRPPCVLRRPLCPVCRSHAPCKRY